MTNLFLLNVPFSDLSNEIYFSNDDERYNYFQSKKIKDELEDFNYIRRDNIIDIPFIVDEVLNANYVMFKNDDKKWIYSFITKLEYMNDGCTRLYIKEDSYQTWISSISFHPSFIEREHVTDDTIGRHTIPENLDVGSVIEETEQEYNSLTSNFYYAVLSNFNPATGKQFDGVSLYHKQLFGSTLFLFATSSTAFINYFIKDTNKQGHIEDIQNLFIIPKLLINENELSESTGNYNDGDLNIPYTFYTLNNTIFNDVKTANIPISKLSNFSDYTPKNNKLFTYPYNYLVLSNNVGNTNIFEYENFTSENADFKIEMSLSIGCSIRCVPQNYRGVDNNYDECISLAKFPTFSWSSDAYTNWLTQNSVNLATTIGSTALNTAISGATGNPLGVVSSLYSITNLIGEFHQAKLLPNISGGQNDGDVNFSANKNTFVFKKMRAKKEYLQVIDDYFNKFGYKVNTIKTPTFNTRRYWNYIKTVDINITGNAPLESIKEIKEMFNNGCTLWNDPANIYNFNLNNSIK